MQIVKFVTLIQHLQLPSKELSLIVTMKHFVTTFNTVKPSYNELLQGTVLLEAKWLKCGQLQTLWIFSYSKVLLRRSNFSGPSSFVIIGLELCSTFVFTVEWSDFFVFKATLPGHLLCIWPPKGGWGCLMSPPVWNVRAVIWFHFAISCLSLLPSPVTLSVLSFSACWPFLLNFFQKILQYFSLKERLFCMAPV